MKPEELLSMRAFDVGDPNTWPDASTITAAVAHIDTLERELAEANEKLNKMYLAGVGLGVIIGEQNLKDGLS